MPSAATQLTASTSSISLPTGMDAVTVTVTGTNGLAGYLQPGARVDVYANVTKISSAVGASAPTLPVPCTELAMANIQVLDVQSTVPSLRRPPRRSTGRTIPALGDAAPGRQPRGSEVRSSSSSQNETVSVVQTQQGQLAPPSGSASAPTRRRRAP